jgi:uncharacterized protein (DUF2252 family)
MTADETAPLTKRTADQQAEGRERRNVVPRKDLGTLADRPASFDVVANLEAQEASRVPTLAPLRHARMAATEFAFLRGAAGVMAYDLSLVPNSGIITQLCGDAHIMNFGVFLSPERHLVFDVNDFDETHPGPFEWDVKRLAASAAVALSEQGYDEAQIAAVLRTSVQRYRESILEFARMGHLDVWYQHLDLSSNIDTLRQLFKTKDGSPVDDIIAKAQRSTSTRAFRKMTTFESGRIRFRSNPPLVVPLDELVESGTSFTGYTTEEIIERSLAQYASTLSTSHAELLSTYEQVDMARKVVGVGSVGTRCFVLLLLGRDLDDPLVLQLKEAMPSVLEDYTQPSTFDSHGARVVAGQRMMQSTPDLFLGHVRAAYTPTESHDFYFRQFHDGKASADLSTVSRIKNFSSYVGICSWTLARAHARGGQRAAIAAYLGNTPGFDKAITNWALAYVERNRADHTMFTEAISSGRIATTDLI